MSRGRSSARRGIGRIQHLMRGGGGRGGIGSKVVAGHFFAAAGVKPFVTNVGSMNGDVVGEIVYAVKSGDTNGYAQALRNYPTAVINSAGSMLGLGIGGGVIRALGNWFGF